MAVSCFGRDAGLRQRLRHHRADALPDFLGVVFDPARPRIMLRQFLAALATALAVPIVDDGPRTGGALVDGKQKRLHGRQFTKGGRMNQKNPSFPRSAWERTSGRSASRPRTIGPPDGTQSVRTCVPTQSVGTRLF